MAYNIIKTKSGAVIETMDKPWDDVSRRVRELNDQGMGVFAKRAGGVSTQGKLSFMLPADADCYFVDAWTSGNPGIGGYRIMDSNRQVIDELNYEDKHTNNFYELKAILQGIVLGRARSHGRRVVVYTDSKCSLAWIASGRHNASRDQQSITDTINLIRDMLRYPHVTVEKWDTETYGEIPADYGRK